MYRLAPLPLSQLPSNRFADVVATRSFQGGVRVSSHLGRDFLLIALSSEGTTCHSSYLPCECLAKPIHPTLQRRVLVEASARMGGAACRSGPAQLWSDNAPLAYKGFGPRAASTHRQTSRPCLQLSKPIQLFCFNSSCITAAHAPPSRTSTLTSNLLMADFCSIRRCLCPAAAMTGPRSAACCSELPVHQ